MAVTVHRGDPFLTMSNQGPQFGVVLYVDEARGAAWALYQSGEKAVWPLPIVLHGKALLKGYAEEVQAA